MRRHLKYAAQKSRPHADRWWFAPFGGLVGAALLWGVGVSPSIDNWLPDHWLVRASFDVVICVGVAYFLMFLGLVLWSPMRELLEPQGGLRALMRRRLGVQMWAIVLMASGLFAFVLLFGAGAILFALSYNRPTSITEAPPAPPKIVAVPTASYDVPKKLEAIDVFEKILLDELDPIVQKGAQLSTGRWWNYTVENKGQQLREEITQWRNSYANLTHRLRKIRDDSGKFPDIQALYDPTYENDFNPRMERFVGVIASIGDQKWNRDQLEFFVKPIASNCYAAVNALEDWRRNRLITATQLRKTYSQ
jgi:hypothetical protein